VSAPLQIIARPKGGGLQVTSPVVVDFLDTPVSRSGVRFNDNGQLQEDAGTFNLILPGEWHGDEPSSGRGSIYDVRCASLTSGTWTNEGAAVGTWITMAGSPEWNVITGTTKQCVAVFEIGLAGVDTAIITFTVDATADTI